MLDYTEGTSLEVDSGPDRTTGRECNVALVVVVVVSISN